MGEVIGSGCEGITGFLLFEFLDAQFLPIAVEVFTSNRLYLLISFSGGECMTILGGDM